MKASAQRLHKPCRRMHVNTALAACLQHGMTPLLLASKGGKVDAIKSLLAAGASFTATDEVRRPATALACIVCSTSRYHIATMAMPLLDMRPNVDKRGK